MSTRRRSCPNSAVFHYKNPDGTKRSVAAFANLFRYTLLERLGGWWVDTDVLRLDPPLPERALFVGWQDEKTACNAILRAPPHHPLIAAARRRTQDAETETLVWGATGPKLITEIVAEKGLSAAVAAREVAYPTHWREYALAVESKSLEDMRRRVRIAPFLHLWQEMFRLKSDGRLDAPEPGSFLDGEYRALSEGALAVAH